MNRYKLLTLPATFTPDGEIITDKYEISKLSPDNIYYIFDDKLEDMLEDEYALVKAALNAVQWIAASGHEGMRLSLVSPFGKNPRSSVLKQERLHTLIRGVRELCPRCLVGGAIRKKHPDGGLVAACDFILLDYRQTSTTKEALEKLLMLKSTPEYYPSKPEIFACGPFTDCEEDMLERLTENGAQILYTEEMEGTDA